MLLQAFSLSPFSKTSGNFALSVQGVSISAGLKLSCDPATGHSTVTCSSCSNHIDSIRVHVSGGHLGYGLLGLWGAGGTSRRTVLIIPVLRKRVLSVASLQALFRGLGCRGGQEPSEGADTVPASGGPWLTQHASRRLTELI